MKTSYHYGELKAQLLKYACARLESGELAELSMREMAKAVGVSHTAAYRHFQDKHALLDAVALQGFEELLRAGHAIAVKPEPPLDRLRELGLAYVRFGLSRPQGLAHMFAYAAHSQASEALKAAGGQLFGLLEGVIAEGQQLGVFRHVPLEPLAHACWAMVHGLATLLGQRLLQLPNPSEAEWMTYAEKTLDIFLDGIAASPAV
ncbi:TetR/AcrR family transcriptional regulator [Roseateles sp. SL47]|uniref:TetR/AcrR family transcriptional regulator n=1 Tax=Roseateles sp. SL47 TaxID=2995138 RepID=UPI002270598D|nr:TetR/AcrR family transcriptional regulator [Roseateles sp. SL47]WAC75464.1 TetR/AcrR family transcriptional regulator [Roseateles sp. SL47]